MIISATRRTDIPSFYGEWLLNRLREGYVLIQNPYNENRYSKAILTKEAVDIIVFWTKNPIPFIKYLDEIDKMGYVYYFQFTMTPYDRSIERNLPNKKELLDSFIYLSNRLGSEKMVWRYDPIIIDDKFTVEYHVKMFNFMASKLKGYTNRCIISFVDDYKNVTRRMGSNPANLLTKDKINEIAKSFSQIAKGNNIELFTCSEEVDLSFYNIKKSACIDKELIEKILGTKVNVKIDRNQREECRCVESIEIGTYNCCDNGCNYCYALQSEESSNNNMKMHNPLSPTLIGEVRKDAIITDRDTRSIVEKQMSLF